MKAAAVGYFDGKISTRRDATLTLDGDRVVLHGEGIDLCYPVASLVIPPGVALVRRTVRLPDGGVCEFQNIELLEELEAARRSGRGERLLHRWERSLSLAIGSLFAVVVVVLLFIRFGLPFMARHVAFALPVATERALGKETLATLDRLLMKPSKLGRQRQGELITLFNRVAGAQGQAAGYRLELRTSPAVGANAFALPAGIVVMTDNLVDLARSDDELAAVMAHELGHVAGRHILRHVMQSSAAGVIVAALTGDITSITSLAATLPTALVNASFSREFEREADDAALTWMKRTGIRPRLYAEFLGRLQAGLNVRQGVTSDDSNRLRNYLSSHPDTGERIRRMLKEEGT